MSLTTTKAAPSTHTFSTRIHVAAKERGPLIELINQHLANLSDLYSQTKYAHWNVRGHHFIGVHKLFDELAEQVEEAVDTVAERISSLGGVARGTARMAVEHSTLDISPPYCPQDTPPTWASHHQAESPDRGKQSRLPV